MGPQPSPRFRQGSPLSRLILRAPLLGTILSSGEAAGSAGAYYWASQKGSATRTGYSPHPVPDISKPPAWSWLDTHEDVIRATPLFDDKSNVYLSTIAGRIYKFDPNGSMLWSRKMPFGTQVVGSIYQGKFITATKSGHVAAISMETGDDVWLSAVSLDGATAGDTASMLAVDGMVISATLTDGRDRDKGNDQVVAVNASDGKILWRYNPDINVYNFQASAPEDGTLVFQDRAGGLYRLRLADGSEVWKSGKRGSEFKHTFTTGATVCHGGLVYVTSNIHRKTDYLGLLHVYKLEDGSPAWEQVLPYEANQAVAIGPHPTEKGRFAAVVGFGRNPGLPAVMVSLQNSEAWMPYWIKVYIGIFYEYISRFLIKGPAAMAAYDAETGQRLWHYELPPYRKFATAGDSERLARRAAEMVTVNVHNDLICLPDSCSQPVMGPDGTAYQGWQDGRIYAIRDANGDGRIDGTEVTYHQLSDGFQGSMGMAPGIFAAAPCGGGLYVWRS